MIGNRIPFGRNGKTRLLVSIPTTGSIHKLVAQAALRIALEESGRDVVTGDIIMPTHVPFENNLHHIVQDVLKRDYDFWLSFDADNPPMRSPVPLVLENKDVVGCATPVWHFVGKEGERPMYWNGYKAVPEEGAYTEWPTKQGLQRVDAIGTGCFMIARRVLEHPSMQKGCFSRTLYPDGTVEKGNDLAFCERAQAAGFDIWCSYDHPCHHFNELDLVEVSRAIVTLVEHSE
jgi:hypothetical protein